MFIPCEGIGAAIAKIVTECGLRPVKLEFLEDRCSVEFTSSDSPSSSRKAKEKVAETGRKYPNGPWEKTGKVGIRSVYRCGDTSAFLKELASYKGVTEECMEYRLRTGGMLEPKQRHSKLEKKGVRKRMSLSV